MSFPEYKWEVIITIKTDRGYEGHTINETFYSRESAEKHALQITTESFDKFISEWRDRIQTELTEQVEENEAFTRGKDSSELNDWAFQHVDNFEKAGLKMIRVDETDRGDYLHQCGNVVGLLDKATVFMVPAKGKPEEYHFFGRVIRLMT